jgi:enamine deaminase RidA (YjgF/YER057c/UK114 family)
MSRQSHSEAIESYGCSIVLRRVEGPLARELFFNCQPPAGVTDVTAQTEAMYRAVCETLQAQGGGLDAIVCETIFLRNPPVDLEPFRAARNRVVAAHAARATLPAITEIGQPPLNPGACLEILVHAVLPHSTSARIDTVSVKPACGCSECARAHGLRISMGGETRLYAGGLYGPGRDAYEQTHGMFNLAEQFLQQAGMQFSDVHRAWIHLREMERDYPMLNRARREFFNARGIDPVPASTGIGGGPVCIAHDICLGVYALKDGHPAVRTVMTSPTLNEASQYGADFVRGLRMREANKVALHVSGTASIDEAGRTAHEGDFEAQADRMLLNIAALLRGQGADFSAVVSAISYLKHPEDAARLRDKFHSAGFTGFPNVLVVAPICRPELLCETEVLAVLP